MEKRKKSGWVDFLAERYYLIPDIDQLPVFLMSVVSAADHWLFIASNGGLTAGRAHADNALFPYETEDKIAAHRSGTGSLTLLQVTREGGSALWEPFKQSRHTPRGIERNLYKNASGTSVLFEERNLEQGLQIRTAWRTGDTFGFIRTVWLTNLQNTPCSVSILDGLQNILACGITKDTQMQMSSLLNAYKRSEIDAASGVGIYSLSATLTDRAEPSESLKATVVWQLGLRNPAVLLTAGQIAAFAAGEPVTEETDVCGRAGAYLCKSDLDLSPGETCSWHIIADVNQDSAAVADLCTMRAERASLLEAEIESDIADNTRNLIRLVAAADGLQAVRRYETAAHHFANVMFNIMRGGVLANGYVVPRSDFVDFLRRRNRKVLDQEQAWLEALPEEIELGSLHAKASAARNTDLVRICMEYLPLSFSRRHGDPSRPWNSFSIHVKHRDGTPALNYQGNWRDIFQNWEPLFVSFPEAFPSGIAKFLNAVTIDGYNPYRVTRDGIEWEVPEPDNPWANIGYWSDHQIIYLQKLLEGAERYAPGTFLRLHGTAAFSTSRVPYRIRPYQEILQDWYNTIDFDQDADREIEKDVSRFGTDARLYRDEAGNVMHVTMAEKLLVLLLAKLTNLIPGGGIWMNTQRPEWNDANNALVGKGLSVVTAAYLARFIQFWADMIEQGNGLEELQISQAVLELAERVAEVLSRYLPALETGFSPADRRSFMDEMGSHATKYRSRCYADGLTGFYSPFPVSRLHGLLKLSRRFIVQTLRENARGDGLYHSYNILELHEQRTEVTPLYLMLEGQVAMLSSGILTGSGSLELVQGLRKSALYRSDQNSYMLYPNRSLPNFRRKNIVESGAVSAVPLLVRLAEDGDSRILNADSSGVFHFNGAFRNSQDVSLMLDEIAEDGHYADSAETCRKGIIELFERTFSHTTFTGRSGTFFAYEGLGSIYWHMVSKLLLAVQKSHFAACERGDSAGVRKGLSDAYYQVRAGLGFNKSPEQYGAFPADPYSHSPWGAGARQPGMTGQVKEEILTRWGELGISVHSGQIVIEPVLLEPEEFTESPSVFTYAGPGGQWIDLALPEKSLAFTFCGIPFLYKLIQELPAAAGMDRRGLQAVSCEVRFSDGRKERIGGGRLAPAASSEIFRRTGRVDRVSVEISPV